MYIRTEEIVREWPRTSKKGKKHTRKVKCKIVHLKCDACGKDFTRRAGDMAPGRCNNKYNHFCSDCPAQSIGSILGQKTKKANLKKKIGQVRYVSPGKGKGKYAWIYVGDTHQYSQPYCGSILEHIMVMENHLGRTLKKGKKKRDSEVVHHIDGNKLNNDIDNLDVMTTEEHNRCHGAAANELLFQLYKEGIITYNRETKRYERNIESTG